MQQLMVEMPERLFGLSDNRRRLFTATPCNGMRIANTKISYKYVDVI